MGKVGAGCSSMNPKSTTSGTLEMGKRGHCCDDCGRQFPDSKDLQRHRVVHTGIKCFSCPKCLKKKTFSEANGLQRHLMNVHKFEAEAARIIVGTVKESILRKFGAADESSQGKNLNSSIRKAVLATTTKMPTDTGPSPKQKGNPG